jgi:hypothetical protein
VWSHYLISNDSTSLSQVSRMAKSSHSPIFIPFWRLSWSYGSWIYNYLCNQCLSPLMLWVQILLGRGVLDTTLCNKVCQWLAAGQWYFPGTPVSPTNKTDRHNIAEISLKVMLSTITPPLHFDIIFKFCLCSHDTVLIRLSDGSRTKTILKWGFD